MKTLDESLAILNGPEDVEEMKWYTSTLKNTLGTIKEARAKVPKNPSDISARWDYPQAVEHLEVFLDAFEGRRNFNDEIDNIEEILEKKKLLPNEGWLVEKYRLRTLGHTEPEVQQLLVKGKVVGLLPKG